MSPNYENSMIKVKTRIHDSEALVGGSVVVIMKKKKNNYTEIKKEEDSEDSEDKLRRHSQVLNSISPPHTPVICNDSAKLLNTPINSKVRVKRTSIELSICRNNNNDETNDEEQSGYDDDCLEDDDNDSEDDEYEQTETTFKLDMRDSDKLDQRDSGEEILDSARHEEARRLEKSLRKKHKRRKRWWATADALVSGIVVCTLGVSTWRGMWTLMDIYSDYFPAWPTVAAGIGIHLTFAFFRGPLHERLSQPPKSQVGRWARAICGRVYCWLFMLACVLHWRGLWLVWAQHVVPEPSLALPAPGPLATAAGVCALAALRSLRNMLAMPYFVSLDKPQLTYDFQTRFRKSAREPLLFVLDCIFSVVVVGSLVVFVWRGAWDMLDFYIYPQDKVWSAWGSAVLGYGLAVVTFLLQPLARRACSHLQAARRLLLADLFLLLSFVATVNVWRSVWMLLDIYFIPENPLLSNWITHAGCLLLLMLLNCANSVMVRGVYIDAEEEGGQCVVFPCYYLRLYFQKERSKKRLRRLEKASQASDRDAMGSLPLVSKSQTGNHVTVTVTEKEHLSEKPADKTNGDDC